jgi:hypothetical protein
MVHHKDTAPTELQPGDTIGSIELVKPGDYFYFTRDDRNRLIGHPLSCWEARRFDGPLFCAAPWSRPDALVFGRIDPERVVLDDGRDC